MLAELLRTILGTFSHPVYGPVARRIVRDGSAVIIRALVHHIRTRTMRTIP